MKNNKKEAAPERKAQGQPENGAFYSKYHNTVLRQSAKEIELKISKSDINNAINAIH